MKFKQRSFLLLALVFLQGLLVSQANASTKPEVVFETSMGSFTLELYPDKAPKTVANFLAYVDDGFYDNTIFHRVIPDFVIQGGGFEPGMKYRKPGAPVKNESSNRLKNLTGTISMARRTHPDTATSQFYINLSHNSSLDYISDLQPGYTVFGRVSKGMDVIDKISVVETTIVGRSKDVPKDDVALLSVKRKVSADSVKEDENADALAQKQGSFVAGEHYVVLDRPVPTRDSSKVEVVELFSYGCPHCYEFEPLVKEWGKQQAGDVDFWFSPAVWSKSMELYAKAFYTARELDVEEKIHLPLFTAIVIKQKSIRNESDLADFFAQHGVDKKVFTETFNSAAVEKKARHAEERVRLYKPVGVPEIIVNGKYRVDRMRAGGLTEMLAVAEYLVNKERAILEK
jgi:cyclophilin family peptidyl-prolyl cis-trans isomerase/protein-disulfide isomerase